MDEASGTRNDSVGTNHLTDNNTVGSAAGKSGNAADFELDNVEYLSIDDNADLSLGSNTDFTWTIWFKPENDSVSSPLITKAGVVSDFDDYAYRIQSDAGGTGKARFTVGNNVTYQHVISNGNVYAAGVWYFVVAWHDSTANKIYIQVNNDTPAEAVWAGGTFDDGGPLRIGAFESGSGVYMDGLIDEVGFWKRVLTAQERTDLYNAGAGLTHPFTGPAYLLYEDFEATGWTGKWWTGGAADPDYTAAPLSGSQSLEVTNGEQSAWQDTVDHDEVWGRFTWKCSTLPASFSLLLTNRDAGYTPNMTIAMLSDGTLSTDSVTFTDPLTAGTLYYIWWHYKKGTGSNCVMEAWFDTVPVRPTAAGKHCGTTTAAHTTSFAHFLPGINVPSGNMVFDDIQIADTDVFNVSLWLKADSLGYSDGDTINTWAASRGSCDATGLAFHDTIFRTGGLNGKPYASLESGTPFFDWTLPDMTPPFCVSMVLNFSSVTDFNAIFHDGNNSGLLFFSGYVIAVLDDVNKIRAAFTPGTDYMLTWIQPDDDPFHGVIRINGVPASSVGFANSGWGLGVAELFKGYGGSADIRGRFYEFLQYDPAIVSDVEAYLATKYTTPEYFGGCNSDGSILGSGGFDFFGNLYGHNDTGVIEFTCPGIGPRTITTLGVYAKDRGLGAFGNIRVALYSNDRATLICEGNAVISVNSAVAQWWDHVSLTGTTTIIGGTKYVLAFSMATNNIAYHFTTLSNAARIGYGTDYTGGFPTPLPNGTSAAGQLLSLRCFVS